MLFCDGEPGAEVYAADREQATLVFEVAKQQVLRQPVLNSSAKVFQKAITIEPMASSFKAIPSDANTKHGYNAHCVVIDELHAQRDRELVDRLADKHRRTQAAPGHPHHDE
jgi:phage terminase large subunit-like protein